MTGRCETIEMQLAEYVSDELSADERAEVESHLAICHPCREELAREVALHETMGTMVETPCPSSVSNIILTEVAIADRSSVNTSWWSRSSATLGLIAAAALLAMVLPTRTPTMNNDEFASALPETNSWTQDDLNKARLDLQWTLSYTASIIDRTEKQSLVNVLRHLQTGS